MAQGPLPAAVAKTPANAAALMLMGKQNDLLVSNFHGKKYHQAYASALFFGANQAGVTTSAGLATTYLGICLSNPAGNTFNLVPRRVSATLELVETAFTSMGLIVGYASAGIVTHTTALTPANAILGATGTATGKLDAACTLVGTPAWAGWFSGAIATTNASTFFSDLEGGIVIPPGGYAAIGTSVASGTSAFWGSIEWEEVAI